MDASKDTYGADVYSIAMYKGRTVSKKLVAPKTKVAPFPTTSMSRLELIAAALGLRMTESIFRVLNINSGQAVFLSNSTTMLWWIRGSSRSLKLFVADRVGEIETETNSEQWQYVPMSKKPADSVTRGVELSELVKSDEWSNEPDFLGQK